VQAIGGVSAMLIKSRGRPLVFQIAVVGDFIEAPRP
jgi:hypothetical protein